jgi:hypothetical protein
VALPLGLTYTALLGPFFYIWVLLKRKYDVFLPFISLFLPFIIVQVFIAGVDLSSYSVSLLNITMIYFFCQAVYTFLKSPADHEKILKRLLIINFIFCLVALAFYFTPFYDLFWIRQSLTKGVSEFLRLKLFTYEASYYAMLFVPVFIFFLLQYMLRQNRMNSALLLSMIFLPIALSFSVGVIGCLLLSGFITLAIHFRRLAPKRRIVNSFISLTAICGITLFILIFFFRNNPVFIRLGNIFSGGDSSGQGRMENAFTLAIKILKEKNEYWGIGPGQLKILGEDIIRSFYLYTDRAPVAIPNAAAETLLLFGWIGLSLRLFIEVFLFFYTKAWTNYFRLMLFLFVFIYQFTGSFITNPVEYVLWILAFTNVFRQFEVRPGKYERQLFNTGKKSLATGMHY